MKTNIVIVLFIIVSMFFANLVFSVEIEDIPKKYLKGEPTESAIKFIEEHAKNIRISSKRGKLKFYFSSGNPSCEAPCALDTTQTTRGEVLVITDKSGKIKRVEPSGLETTGQVIGSITPMKEEVETINGITYLGNSKDFIDQHAKVLVRKGKVRFSFKQGNRLFLIPCTLNTAITEYGEEVLIVDDANKRMILRPSGIESTHAKILKH